MRHLYRCPLRWGDMDAFQHVNNVAFLEYLQEARVDMFWVHPQRSGLTPLAQGMVVARHEISYVAPLTWREEPVIIETWLRYLRPSSFELEHLVRDEEKKYATARSVLVPYDLENQRPRRLSADEKAALEPYLERTP
ncbi:thioesterase superfamily protein [mine drainage metagenome]|uniref:Thioesterase superfamily protein n=1 Tax=mine drainage metagenome TaxID=410659 RepID=A0A1J5PQR3_9ZZZZ